MAGETQQPAASEQELLTKLINEALVPSNPATLDLSRYRTLLEVLVKACILDPIRASQPIYHNASLTLKILQDRTTEKPELLTWRSDQEQPLYQWLISNLTWAATGYDKAGDESLVDEIVAAIKHILETLRLVDGGSNSAYGTLTAQRAGESIFSWCQDTLGNTQKGLFGFENLWRERLAVIILLRVVVETTSLSSFSICRQLTRAGRILKKESPAIWVRQYVGAVTSALDRGWGPLLGGACSQIVTFRNQSQGMPLSQRNGHPRTESTKSIRAFADALERSEQSLRVNVWWDVYRFADELDPSKPVHRVLVDILFTPIPGFKTVPDIIALLPELVPQLQDRAEEWPHVSAALRPNSTPARKRKRQVDASDLRKVLPALGDLDSGSIRILMDAASSASTVQLTTISQSLDRIICEIAGCAEDHCRELEPEMYELWLVLWRKNPSLTLLSALNTILSHVPIQESLVVFGSTRIQDTLFEELKSAQVQRRTAASRAIATLFAMQDSHPDPSTARRGRQNIIQALEADLPPVQITVAALLGNIARALHGDEMGEVLKRLLELLGSPASAVKAVAFAELFQLAQSRGKTPYTLLLPHLELVSVLVCENLVRKPDMVVEILNFIGHTRQNFISTTFHFSIPALVISQNRAALEQVASITKEPLGILLLDHTPTILAKSFLSHRASATLNFLISFLQQMMKGNTPVEVTVPYLMATCIVPVLVLLIVELGDPDTKVAGNALRALGKAQQYHKTKGDLGTFLKPHMLGVISNLIDILHDMQGKKTVEYKRKVIRSLGALIESVGDSMATFSPQIIASLQSTMGIPELRSETLQTWRSFMTTLKWADIGPFIGRTTAAIVNHWSSFDKAQKAVASAIVNDLADNSQPVKDYLDDVLGLQHIPELRKSALKLIEYRKAWPFQQQLGHLLERIQSKNIALSTVAVDELARLLRSKADDLHSLTLGDKFSTVMTKLMHGLMTAATRDGECDDLRDSAYECLGLIGALDPDRLAQVPEETQMMVLSNFSDHEESISFALHLVRDILVDAFRATNDTKHQNHLAFAIQELLRFCDFTPKVLQSAGSGGSSKARDRWESLPKDHHETLTPLLESKYSLSDIPPKECPHPVYLHSPTYREWLQTWAADLINKLQDGFPADSRSIFGVMRGVLRYQDVTVAHHILPHLVLHVILSGTRQDRQEICAEIHTVLQDHSSQDGRQSLSAQVIFELMDHLSKWQRQSRGTKADRGKEKSAVIEVIASVDTELMARAALQSKSYARSLRGFEQRIVHLRREGRGIGDLQHYYEQLHHIYAELDDPDGMEGVSTSILSPSLYHRIREHESTGSWTAAQSCWEVRLQQSPESLELHVGLLNCLRNLGHYDTLRTHVQGVQSRHPDWAERLAPFEAQAAWTVGDWPALERTRVWGGAMAEVMLALHKGEELEPIMKMARRVTGQQIGSKDYSRNYDAILQLHALHDIEMIHATGKLPTTSNQQVVAMQTRSNLIKSWDLRVGTASPSFRHRETLLSIRRSTLGITGDPQLKSQIGNAWIQSSKNARKAGYEQTAYSASLQAGEVDAPFAFIQQVKLLRAHGGVIKALTELENALKPMLVIDLTGDHNFERHRSLAKAALLEARWADQTDRFELNAIVERFRRATRLDSSFESPYYHLGHYYDIKSEKGDPLTVARFNLQTCRNYCLALEHGVKYIYRTMPRMLTVWLDMAELKEKDFIKKWPEIKGIIEQTTKLIDKARRELPAYQFFTAYPQIVSRIGHKDAAAAGALRKIMARVILEFPHQALWPTVGVMLSKREDRQIACYSVLDKCNSVGPIINDAKRLASALLQLADHKIEDKKRDFSLAATFPYLRDVVPSKMIMPLQASLTCALPKSAELLKTHKPFPDEHIEIKGIVDRIDVMSSLQKPKRITMTGSNGEKYPFLCKPHDDLRKDARLMDFNGMINKFLNSASESRRRQLYIRTYAVTPLNEECGLLEWVQDTNALKNILEAEYTKQNKRIYTNEVARLLDDAKGKGPEVQIATFRDKILPIFQPTVFQEWFLITWPEPTAWLNSRTAYSRTLAVMSMVGYVLGLGDRHGENILFDGRRGDTVHVDLNCLFDKGKTFEIPERVPFRLTQNMVDALGVTGVEGAFRKAAEISMGLLRSNSESLMSVLEAFVHDPLVEWTKSGRKQEKDVKTQADKNLKPIKAKLRGDIDGSVVTVANQVETLIQQAVNPACLGLMYQGWAPWL